MKYTGYTGLPQSDGCFYFSFFFPSVFSIITCVNYIRYNLRAVFFKKMNKNKNKNTRYTGLPQPYGCLQHWERCTRRGCQKNTSRFFFLFWHGERCIQRGCQENSFFFSMRGFQKSVKEWMKSFICSSIFTIKTVSVPPPLLVSYQVCTCQWSWAHRSYIVDAAQCVPAYATLPLNCLHFEWMLRCSGCASGQPIYTDATEAAAGGAGGCYQVEAD